MDAPFEPSAWESLRRPGCHAQPGPIDLGQLAHDLARNTTTLRRWPYNPAHWTQRSLTLEKLGYYELVMGDCVKAQMLLKLLSQPKSGYRLGHQMGFWMETQEDDAMSTLADDQTRLREGLEVCQRQIDHMLGRHQRWIPQPYPWLPRQFRVRSAALLEAWNAEFRTCQIVSAGADRCEIRRHAFGPGVGPESGSELLGVFANRTINRGQALMSDRAQLVGRYDATSKTPGAAASNRSRQKHPRCDLDLQWIQAQAGPEAAEAILRARFLQICHRSMFLHPLEHPLMARLVPCYGTQEQRDLSTHVDIGIPNAVLTRLGIDVFADQRYDTWVLYTIQARIDNNFWSDPGMAALCTNFSAFNHSCEPNVHWQYRPEKLSLHLMASRAISKNEQLFVAYDSFLAYEDLETRRFRLNRWLNGPCRCARCLREETAIARGARRSTSWDCDVHPELPEAEIPNKA